MVLPADDGDGVGGTGGGSYEGWADGESGGIQAFCIKNAPQPVEGVRGETINPTPRYVLFCVQSTKGVSI